MPTLILARHGRTTANASGMLAGRTPGVHLDDKGREQARAAASRIEGLSLEAAISSPLVRCRETARLLVPESRVEIDPGLNECDYGQWAGQSLATLAKDPLWKTVQAHPSAARFPGGESMAQMSARAVSAVRARNASLNADSVWLAVTHGDIIKAILADALGVHLDAFQRIVVDPASLSIVRYETNGCFVLGTNTHQGSLASLGAKRPKRGRKQAAVGGGQGEVNL